MSPDLQVQRQSDYLELDQVKGIVSSCCPKADGVTISGGEPFDQINELTALLEWLKAAVSNHIIVYTGYRLAELYKFDGVARALDCISVLIDGPYIMSLDDGKGLRGSHNQTVHRLRDGSGFAYEKQAREVQSFVLPSGIFMVGLQ